MEAARTQGRLPGMAAALNKKRDEKGRIEEAGGD